MPLKLNLAIPNKAVHAFIGILILFVLVAGTFAYNDMVLKLAPPATVPNPGHSSTEVMINLGPDTGDPCSGDVTLQSGLDNDCFNISNPFVPTCSEGEILETDSSGAWQCVAYTDPPFIPSCADDEILKASSGTWACVPDEGIETKLCSADEYLKFDGTDWVCDTIGPCTPSSACAAITCVGEQCSDSCGNLYAGTKTDGICCTDTSWSPATSTVCLGTTFTQTSNCGRTRSASGTMTGGTCCIVTTWSPSPSTVCSGTTFTQTSNCGTTRTATGTQSCGSICVSGSYSSCVSSGGVWTGSWCCVVGASNCVSGSYSSCVSSGGVWTGSYCCIVGPSACVTGSYSSCVSSGGIWTGSYCCVPNATPATCVSGSYSSCVSTGGVWTGSYCCVPGASTCVPGSYSSCVSTGGTWTGSFCCV